MINIIKNKRNRNLWALILALLIIIALPAYELVTGSNLTAEASIETDENAVFYDLNNIMSYYIDSINDEGTMVYAHYNNDSGDEDEVTCLSCHEMDMLRELYYKVDASILEEAMNSMNSSETTLMCLTCHGSYQELAALTADYTGFADGEGTVANPHIYGGGLAESSSEEQHYALSCLSCHSGHTDMDAITMGIIYCYGCHHDEVFECGTCHELF